jgi:LacI family transcriptional regulator
MRYPTHMARLTSTGPTLQQVATLAGVSLATASRVLSKSDYPVRPETRARVLQAAQELDFQPNLLARGLVSAPGASE